MDAQRLQQILNGVLIRNEDGSYRETTLRERMEHFHCTAFSFAVIRGGQTDLVFAEGTTSRGGAAPVLPSTPFRVASVSKIITAVGVQKLAQQGILDLDEDVHRYFADDYVIPAAPGLSNRVTLRQILGHLAGLNSHGYSGYVVGTPRPTLDELLRGRYPARTGPLQVVYPQNSFVPCTAENPQGPYSGGGYCVAQKVIEDVTGRPFADVMEELVLAPFGMRSSTFRQSCEPEFRQKFPEQPVCGYNPTRGGIRLDHWEAVPGGNRIAPDLAAGGLWSTPEDLAKFGTHLQAILREDCDPALPRTALQEMLTKQKNSANGLGFYLLPTAKQDVFLFQHTGCIDGFLSMACFTSDGCGLTFAFNSNEGMLLYLQFARAVVRAYPEFPISVPQIAFSEDDSRTLRVRGED